MGEPEAGRRLFVLTSRSHFRKCKLCTISVRIYYSNQVKYNSSILMFFINSFVERSNRVIITNQIMHI